MSNEVYILVCDIYNVIMEDFKNILRVIGILVFLMLLFFWEFRLYETDSDVKNKILTEETPKSYNFKILSCKEYRGFEFLGISSRGDTIREHLSPFWDLYQKYSVGDKIVKLKGTKEILLIKQSDTLQVHLFYKREEL